MTVKRLVPGLGRTPEEVGRPAVAARWVVVARVVMCRVWWRATRSMTRRNARNGRRSIGHISWDGAFSSRYDEWSAFMTEDVPLYVELALEADGPLVELAVGNGRVAIPVAQATGRSVIGIDTSEAMLEQARARAGEAGVQLDLRHGDMRELALGAPAALICCPFERSCTCRGGATGAGRSSGLPRRCDPAAWRGTSSRSITGLRLVRTASIRTSRCRTPFGAWSATTAST